jgi:hypothetical protein
MNMHKQSSSAMSSLAARILKGYQPTPAEVRSLAASVLSQDGTKGQGKRAGARSVVPASDLLTITAVDYQPE